MDAAPPVAPLDAIQALVDQAQRGEIDHDLAFLRIERIAEQARPFALPDGATVNADGSVDYPLSYPIEMIRNGVAEPIDTVTVKRRKLADNLAIKDMKNPIDVMATLTQRLTGLDHKIAAKLDDVDLEAIGTIIEGFSMPGRATGSVA